MRFFMRFTRWLFLAMVLLNVVLWYNMADGKGTGGRDGVLFLFVLAVLTVKAFVLMCIVNFVGWGVISDRKDRARLYSSKQYRVKLEN
jgi:4-hydroxybenzoate polyprenyltransferase